MRSALLLAATATILVASPVAARDQRTRAIDTQNYIEVDQTVFGDLKNGGDVLTYTTLAAGSDTRIATRRVELQLNSRYEYRFGWGDQEDADILSGIARGRFIAVPNLLNFEAGGLATRTRQDIRNDAFNPVIGNPSNVTQLYSVFAGPSLATNVGGLAVSAAYNIGYTKTESGIRGVPITGQPVRDIFDSSVSHRALVSVGMPSGRLPFGWTVSGGWEREDATQLDQRYQGYFGRADAVVPLTPSIAAVGGVGYENIEASQRDALLDASGNPVIDSRGRFQTDPASPRRLTYETDGFIWDAGLQWRPSRRTSAEFRVGRRYGSMTYVGSLSYQASEALAVQLGLYDGIQTFGRQVNSALIALPTAFTVARNPFGNPVTGCVFGANGGQGGCLSPALQSVATGVYRTRGVNAVASYSRGPWQAGVGLGYAHRRFLANPGGGIFPINGISDQSIYAQAYIARQIDAVSGVDASVYANWYSSDQIGSADVLGTGVTASYYRNFGPRFSTRASVGLYSTRIDGIDSSLTGAAQLGARYTF